VCKRTVIAMCRGKAVEVGEVGQLQQCVLCDRCSSLLGDSYTCSSVCRDPAIAVRAGGEL
jgi:hypothetical protein